MRLMCGAGKGRIPTPHNSGSNCTSKIPPAGERLQGKSGPAIPGRTTETYRYYTFFLLTGPLFKQTLNIQQKNSQSHIHHVYPRPICGKLWKAYSDTLSSTWRAIICQAQVTWNSDGSRGHRDISILCYALPLLLLRLLSNPTQFLAPSQQSCYATAQAYQCIELQCP